MGQDNTTYKFFIKIVLGLSFLSCFESYINIIFNQCWLINRKREKLYVRSL